MKKTKTAKKKKAARRPKVATRAKTSKARKVTARKVRPAAKKKRTAKKRATRPAAKEIRSPETSTLGGDTFSAGLPSRRGGSARSAGQSGDVQGLSRRPLVDSESVEELVEEGQAREAAAISGVEDAPDPDEAEVRTRQVPEDDVPEEYTDED